MSTFIPFFQLILMKTDCITHTEHTHAFKCQRTQSIIIVGIECLTSSLWTIKRIEDKKKIALKIQFDICCCNSFSDGFELELSQTRKAISWHQN